MPDPLPPSSPAPLHAAAAADVPALLQLRGVLGLGAAGAAIGLSCTVTLWWLARSGAAWLPAALLTGALAGGLALAAAVALLAWHIERSAARAVDAAQRRRQALLQLLDTLPLAIALCPLRERGGTPNQAMSQLLGLEPGSPGPDWPALLAEADRPAWQAAWDVALQGGRPQWIEVTMTLADGTGVGRHAAPLLAQLSPRRGDEGAQMIVCLSALQGDGGLDRRTLLQLRQLLALAEGEKWDFGQAVHDELGQRLSGMAYFAKALQRKLQKAGRPEAEDAGWLTDLANESMSVARDMARALVPVGSDDPGALGAALAELCEKTAKAFGIRCEVSVDPDFDAGGAAQASHLYHALQELVNNAVRHGQARQVQVRLQALDDRLQATVDNDGLALPAGNTRRGMGLSGVRSRAAYLGAQFAIADRPEGGVQARIEWPRAGASRGGGLEALPAAPRNGPGTPTT